MWTRILRRTLSIPLYTSIPDKAIPNIAIPNITIVDTVTRWFKRDY